MKDSAPLETGKLTLEALVQLHDEVFVNSAYEAILGRTSDPGGLRNYLTQVRTGVRKAHIVAELAQSPEGRLKSLDLPGLRKAIAEDRKRAPTLWGRLVRRLASASTEETERQLRVIENKLYLLEQGQLRQSKQLAELLTLAQGTMPSAGNFSPSPRSSKDDTEKPAPPLSHLSPKLGRTFADLKAAITAKQSN